MNSQQSFEMAILIVMAILAIAAIGAVASIIRGRRNSWVKSLPTERIADRPRHETADEYARRTNYGMF